MNIFELGAILGAFAGAFFAYRYVSPYNVVLGGFAAAFGAVVGFFVGHFSGWLILLPFEGVARLCRFVSTGRWTDPRIISWRHLPPDERP